MDMRAERACNGFAAPRPTSPAAERLLVVGGEEADRGLTVQFELRGYDVAWVPRLPSSFPAGIPDLVLLAPARWDADHAVEQRRLARLLPRPAIIVLHPASATDCAVRVLEGGADDCLLAPHNPREVVARVRALLRRRSRTLGRYGGRRWVFDGHELDSIRMTVRSPAGREVEITPAQHRLLLALLARPGEVVSREDLLAEVLGEAVDAFDRAIDVHVSRLKRRLAQVSGADLISAYRGVGYRLQVKTVLQ